MRLVSLLFLPALLSFCVLTALAQTPKQVSVRLSVHTSESPTPRITLSWVREAKASAYMVQRKTRYDSQFSTIANIASTDSTFSDDDVQPGNAYEYAVNTIIMDKDTIRGAGYAYCGIKVPPVAIRGYIMVLTDETMATPLATELQTLRTDLENEGWIVTMKTAARAEKFDKNAVKNTKNIIREWYDNLIDRRASVFIIGRVAVPYSGMNHQGNIVLGPDAHPDHAGAWAADTYYAFMGNDESWTDERTNDILIADLNGDKKPDTVAISAGSKNFPGDGKFDNAYIPDYLAIRIGRVDFYNMDKFKKGTQTSVEMERELLRAYLVKDHAYRTGAMPTKMRALVDDNFGGYGGEHFARSGWMNFSVLVGRDNIYEKDWFTTLDTAAYLWAYGCGGGNYEGAGGVGSTADFVAKGSNAVFTMLFGSYFGDWDKSNNFLRATIASSPSILTCGWAGRPFWYCHTMALGETIGDAALLSQNADPYLHTFGTYGVHTALMGDPSLRMNYGTVPPARNVAVRQVALEGRYVEVSWDPPASGSVEGYILYKQVGSGDMEVVNPDELIKATRFEDKSLAEGTVKYTVRAVGLISSTCGTFYDISYPAAQSAKITTVEEQETAPRVEVYPNPARDAVSLNLNLGFPQPVEISVYNLEGSRITQLETRVLAAGEHRLVWNMLDTTGTRVPHGVYVVHIAIGKSVMAKKVVVLD